jgi:phenylacetate-coenzyme A ligase PaaK-like adenylate-forming protein
MSKLKMPHLGGKELDIDVRIEEIVEQNFDPENGSEYWIDYAREKDLQSGDVTSYDDLHHLGSHDWSVFKEGRATQLIPKSAEQQFYKTTSSGTTSQKKIGYIPKSFVDSSNEWWLYNLEREGLPSKPRIWGIGSPEFWGENVQYVAEQTGGLFAPIYPETRGAKEFLIKVKKIQEDPEEKNGLEKVIDMVTERYPSLTEDTINIFKAIEPNVVVAPASILQMLPFILMRGGLDPEPYLNSIEMVVTGGDELSVETYQSLPMFFPEANIVPYFGHFLVGAAFARGDGLNYFPNAAGVQLEVIGEDGKRVDYGEKGRIVINFYDGGLLWRVEDDVGRRVKPIDDILWDGVTDISRYVE